MRMAGNRTIAGGAAAQHAEAVEAAIVQTFDDGCGIRLAPSAGGTGPGDGDEAVIGIVSVGGAAAGTTFMALGRGSAAAAAEAFLGTTVPFHHEDTCRAVGEVVALFSARLKAALRQRRLPCVTSTPAVLRAESLGAFIAESAPRETACFCWRSGTVWVGALGGA